jgi:hypothetical protein
MPQNKRKRDAQMTGQDLARGLPGHRNREGRSGLDPLDTSAEASRLEGVLLRKALTGRARTRSPFYLALMFLFGVVPFCVILALQVGSAADLQVMFKLSRWPLLAVEFLMWIIMLLVPGLVASSFVVSILEILRVIPPVQDKPED